VIRSSILALLLAGAPAAATLAQATQASVDVVQDPPADQPLGRPLQWSVRSSGAGTMSYRLSVERPDGTTLVFVDYRRSNVFKWAPSSEGTYVVNTSAKDEVSGEVVTTSTSLRVFSRVTDSPKVTLTDHPLVALFSSPPCDAGLHMRVLFRARDARMTDATPTRPCDAVNSMNVYVAGLLERTEHTFRAEFLRNGRSVGLGPELTLRAGASQATLPVRATTIPPTAMTSLAEDVLLQSPAGNTVLAGASEAQVPVVPWASDLSGRVLWYYDADPNDMPALLQPVPGGTFLITMGEDGLEGQVLREIDPLGNVIRETNRRRVSDQLVAMGQDSITAFHHDALRLPDGRTAVIAGVERLLEGVQGRLPTGIVGDMIIVLNRNWQVVWVWNAFDHLDVTRRATLDETCARDEPGCPPFSVADVVNDWTHTNAITYSPIDGNLLFSVRNQDWIVKADYRDGAGNGDVLWRLGPDGDFAIDASPNDPYPWLSHQHDPRFVDRRHLVVYDNGNTRCALIPDMCFSRGQVYHLDQSNRVATLTLSFNLGSYSFALGSAQPLSNGNFHFNSGTERGQRGGLVATSDEVSSDGRSFVYAHLTELRVYRSWRLTNLYQTVPDP